MRDLEHPLIRSGSDWPLVVMLCLALSVLAGNALLTLRAASRAPDPSTLFLFRYSTAP